MDYGEPADTGTPQSAIALSGPSQRRPAQNGTETQRSKRAKYTSAACNQCKKSKLKCIRRDNESDCQRCLSIGAPCVFVPGVSNSAKDKDKQKDKEDGSQYMKLSEEIAILRQQVTALTGSIRTLAADKSGGSDTRPSGPQHASPIYISTTSQRPGEPRQPQFVGPTRSAFSFNIAETSLTRMGIPTDTPLAMSEGGSMAGSPRDPTPELDSRPGPSRLEPDCLLSFSGDEVIRLLDVFQEEVASVHPFINTKEIVINVPHILEYARNPQPSPAVPRSLGEGSPKIGKKDVHIVKIAIATGIILEAHGKNELSTTLVESVEPDVCRISSDTEVELKDLQIMTMLSLYYFHDDEELLAWRTIGTAAREALEMGLHRKQSLRDNFKDPDARNLAVRAFWCVYVLDRRWSFGTSLSFALIDRDIDPELPEPGEDFPYLRCMVAYGRLCSKVWEALPPFGSPSHSIPKETVAFLDFVTQNWLASIPQDLQLRHPRLGLAPRTQPRVLHRLRVLLYLRGNHMRTLIHRHHVLSAASIMADMQSARLVVDIAQDSIQVLVHLNETSDIFVRQQSVFNYYLLSALAVIFLAVCHAPSTFAEPCRDAFLAAVELVKGFSRRGMASRRLWKSIRGLLPGVKSLGLQSDTEGRQNREVVRRPTVEADTNLQGPAALNTQQPGPSGNVTGAFNNMWAGQGTDLSTGLSSSVPDLFNMSSDLMSLFDAFGQTAGQPLQPDMSAGFFRINEQGLPVGDTGEISRRFQGLI
ncbi:fungal-specific transcription factor domain-containing protein [Zopfia rhizophila CBS 207.26]|uniref:Fungal-specific transcription factor domain-containing protein n=1 Tax=Zopfia rhizophila CBS 207.26 TaxID=1314779 RepID=A0A6A6DBW6_9PEZI|nr:fungal-specific transcription factor domain-containing protein [Zopfia rhizophila CBS 207.26]